MRTLVIEWCRFDHCHQKSKSSKATHLCYDLYIQSISIYIYIISIPSLRWLWQHADHIVCNMWELSDYHCYRHEEHKLINAEIGIYALRGHSTRWEYCAKRPSYALNHNNQQCQWVLCPTLTSGHRVEQILLDRRLQESCRKWVREHSNTQACLDRLRYVSLASCAA